MMSRILADIFRVASLPPKDVRAVDDDDVLDRAFGIAMQHTTSDEPPLPTATRPLTPLYLSDADTESVVLQDSRVATAAPPWRGSGVGDRADDAAVCVAEHAQFFATTRRAEPRVGAMALFSFLVRPDDAPHGLHRGCGHVRFVALLRVVVVSGGGDRFETGC
jgi:hypothetical protein